MNQQELDQLLQKNEARIEEIKARFNLKMSNTQTYHEVLHEQKENFKTRQKHTDNSLAYPTYGRGLTPDREMNTFMIQPNLAGSPGQRRDRGGEEPGSP